MTSLQEGGKAEARKPGDLGCLRVPETSAREAGRTRDEVSKAAPLGTLQVSNYGA